MVHSTLLSVIPGIGNEWMLRTHVEVILDRLDLWKPRTLPSAQKHDADIQRPDRQWTSIVSTPASYENRGVQFRIGYFF